MVLGRFSTVRSVFCLCTFTSISMSCQNPSGTHTNKDKNTPNRLELDMGLIFADTAALLRGLLWCFCGMYDLPRA